MLFLDVDRLKDVNDTVGHDVGDALLAQVANRIAQATRPSDVVARIGGDEFVVLCDGDIDEHTALELAERIRIALSGRIMIHGVEVDLTVSIGVALANSAQIEGVASATLRSTLLRNSDKAMYTAKRRGRSRCELYTEQMRAECDRAEGARRRPRAGAGQRRAAPRVPADHLDAQRPRRRRRGAAALGSPDQRPAAAGAVPPPRRTRSAPSCRSATG